MSSTVPSELALARACGDGWCRVTRYARHGEIVQLPGGSLGIGGEDFAEMNWAVVHGPEGVEEAMRAFAQRLRARELPGVIGVLPEVAGRAAAVAAGMGLIPDAPWPLMACRRNAFRGVDSACPAGSVGSEAEVKETARVIAAAFGLAPELCVAMMGDYLEAAPDVDFWLARVDGVAAAAVGTARVGPVVGVYAMGTVPELRRRGAGAAALGFAMQSHIDRGAEAFVLEASTVGAYLYRRLGYETVCLTPVWLVG
jgi:hypothetical protein